MEDSFDKLIGYLVLLFHGHITNSAGFIRLWNKKFAAEYGKLLLWASLAKVLRDYALDVEAILIELLLSPHSGSEMAEWTKVP